MISHLILLAAMAGAEVGTLPVENIDKEYAPQAIQAALDQTFSVNGGTIAGVVTITSNTEVQGELAISRTGNGLTFPDGTRQTTAASATTYTSTCTTWVSGVTATQTACNGCIAKSTVTYTSNGKRVRFEFSGSVAMSAINNFRMNFLQDGAHVAPLSPSVGMPDITVPGATYRTDATFQFTTPTTVSAGSHSYCLQICVDGDTATLGPNSSVVQVCARDVD